MEHVCLQMMEALSPAEKRRVRFGALLEQFNAIEVQQEIHEIQPYVLKKTDDSSILKD